MSMQPVPLEGEVHNGNISAAPPIFGRATFDVDRTAARDELCFVASRDPNREFEFDAFNETFATLVGRPRIQPGMQVQQALPHLVARPMIERLRECEASRSTVQFELPVRRNRHVTTWNVSLVPMSASGGGFQIAGRAWEASALIERNVPEAVDKDILERLAATSHDILYVFDLPDQSLVYINERIRAVLGYEVHEIPATGELFRPLVHQSDLSNFDEHCRSLAVLPDKTVRSVEFRARRADGHYAWLRCSDAVFRRDESGAVIRIIGSAIDVTDNRHLLEDLKRISSRLLETQSEERRRIARELHDSTAQQLVGISVGLARLEQIRKSDSGRKSDKAEMAEVLKELREVARDAQQELRTLSYLLHPPILESVGLADALRRFLAGFTRRTRIRTRLVVSDTFSCGSHSVSTALMRIAQEALINVFRHAKASEVRISLINQNRRTILEVEDNGKGMPAEGETADDRIEGLGVGIPGMRARVRQFHGELQITSGTNGTVLRAVIPDRMAPRLEVEL
jgi:PAS domain S-box-containing protein